jgi:hypothetical protein
LAGQCQIHHEDTTGKLTAYFDWSDKTEPNEDATTFYVNPTTAPSASALYRPFTFPASPRQGLCRCQWQHHRPDPVGELSQLLFRRAAHRLHGLPQV